MNNYTLELLRQIKEKLQIEIERMNNFEEERKQFNVIIEEKNSIIYNLESQLAREQAEKQIIFDLAIEINNMLQEVSDVIIPIPNVFHMLTGTPIEFRIDSSRINIEKHSYDGIKYDLIITNIGFPLWYVEIDGQVMTVNSHGELNLGEISTLDGKTLIIKNDTNFVAEYLLLNR